MSRKLIFKSVAMITLLGFFLLSVPGLSSAPKKSSKFDFRVLIKKPAAMISSFFSVFTPIFDTENPDTSKTIGSDNSGTKIKPLGDILIVKPSKDD